MNPWLAYALGVVTPFAASVALVGALVAREWWERHRDDSVAADRRTAFIVFATIRDDSLEDFEAWENELEEVDEP